MENVGSWEREVAKAHKLHHSWLTPASHGGVCPCCEKLRDYSHYVLDKGVCVFCSVACEDRRKCSSKKIRVEIESEEAIYDRPARVLVYEGDQLVEEVIAVVEPKQGLDGGYYPCVTLRKRSEQ